MPAFRVWCRRLLQRQIEEMRPRAILTLGSEARRFVGEMAVNLSSWRSNPAPVVGATLGDYQTKLAALLHPRRLPRLAW